MKMLGINASPKGAKSETLKLVKAVLNGAKSKGFKVELVDLCTPTPLHPDQAIAALGLPPRG